jgi:6,7-dimethyl-8-ribityllumazine synthase
MVSRSAFAPAFCQFDKSRPKTVRVSMMALPRRSPAALHPDPKGGRFLVVEACFYTDIAAMLLEGAKIAFAKAGASLDLVEVPGALEIPLAMAIALDQAEAAQHPFDGAVALGCVIRGDTIHFDIVSIQSARAIMDLSVAHRFPIGNGIITVDNDAQAWMRARVDEADKGGDAARAALALIGLKRRLNAG